tara:strand:- start:64 stop:252 length:189 start_codon:yes stop_codon:yes gene_type:complete
MPELIDRTLYIICDCPGMSGESEGVLTDGERLEEEEGVEEFVEEFVVCIATVVVNSMLQSSH